MNKKILISIICVTYNHEKFIEKAIKGFLMQKTSFDYEILIHDDASSDKTKKIIKEYEKKYKNLIKVIYQKENQYSQGKSPTVNLFNIAKGKYLAFCEGDDYWIDEYKLQKQVNFLEKNKNFSAVYSNVLIVNGQNKLFNDKNARKSFPLYDNFVLNKFNEYRISPLGQASGLVCINFWNKTSEILKKEYIQCKVNGDVKIYVLLNQLGDIFYSKEIMSCYRRTYTGDSWNARILNKDLSEYFYRSNIEIYNFLLKVFNFKINLKYLLLNNICANFYYFLKKPTKYNFMIFYKIYKKSNINIFDFLIFFIKKILKKLKIIKSVDVKPLYKYKIDLKGKKNL